MITLRGQILVSRTNDDPLLLVCMYKTPSVCRFKTPLCVLAPRAHVETHERVVPAHTGTFLNAHTEAFLNPHTVFFHVFSACRNTHTQTRPTTTPRPQRHTPHGDRDRERERKRDRKETRRWKRRDEKRQEKMKEERRDM